MRRNSSADCTGEPPGELTVIATALRRRSANALSSASAWLASDTALRHWLGPMTPSKRTTATTGGGLRSRSIGNSFRALPRVSRTLISRQDGDRFGAPPAERILVRLYAGVTPRKRGSRATATPASRGFP